MKKENNFKIILHCPKEESISEISRITTEAYIQKLNDILVQLNLTVEEKKELINSLIGKFK